MPSSRMNQHPAWMQADHQQPIQNQQTENNSEYQVNQPLNNPLGGSLQSIG